MMQPSGISVSIANVERINANLFTYLVVEFQGKKRKVIHLHFMGWPDKGESMFYSDRCVKRVSRVCQGCVKGVSRVKRMRDFFGFTIGYYYCCCCYYSL